MLSQRQALAADAAALFAYEMVGTLRIGSVSVPAMVTDVASTSTDAFGGADPIDLQTIIVLTSSVATVDTSEGVVAYTSVDGSAAKERKKLVVSAILAPDEVTTSITLRAA